HYAQDLAAAFHQFYTQCRVITEDGALSAARLALCDATRQLLALTLSLLAFPHRRACRPRQGNVLKAEFRTSRTVRWTVRASQDCLSI
ncbi:MAG: hypothetical protein IJG53_04415, partial [Eggerthellaceae bacterium]|nr:hypothetical protein [Eggerthellaceae bacterium]